MDRGHTPERGHFYIMEGGSYIGYAYPVNDVTGQKKWYVPKQKFNGRFSNETNTTVEALIGESGSPMPLRVRDPMFGDEKDHELDNETFQTRWAGYADMRGLKESEMPGPNRMAYKQTGNPKRVKLEGVTDSRGVELKSHVGLFDPSTLSNQDIVIKVYAGLASVHRRRSDNPDVYKTETESMNNAHNDTLDSDQDNENIQALAYLAPGLRIPEPDGKREPKIKGVVYALVEARAEVIRTLRRKRKSINNEEAKELLNQATIEAAKAQVAMLDREAVDDTTKKYNTEAVQLLQSIISSVQGRVGWKGAKEPTRQRRVVVVDNVGKDWIQSTMDVYRLFSQKSRDSMVDWFAKHAMSIAAIAAKRLEELVQLEQQSNSDRPSTEAASAPPSSSDITRETIAIVHIDVDAGVTFRSFNVALVTATRYIPPLATFIMRFRDHNKRPVLVKTRAAFLDSVVLNNAVVNRYLIENKPFTHIFSHSHAPLGDILACSFRKEVFPRNLATQQTTISLTSTNGQLVAGFGNDPPSEMALFVLFNTSREQQRKGDAIANLASMSQALLVRDPLATSSLYAVYPTSPDLWNYMASRSSLEVNLVTTIGFGGLFRSHRGKAYDRSVRESVLIAHLQGLNAAQIARQTRLSAHTVRRYIEQMLLGQYDSRQGANNAPANQARIKLTDDQQASIYEITTTTPQLSSEEVIKLYNKVALKHGKPPITASVSTLNRWRRRMGLTYKHSEGVPTNLLVRSLAMATNYFEAERLPQLRAMRQRLVFIDEASLYLNEAPSRVWGVRGGHHPIGRSKLGGLGTKLIIAVGFPSIVDNEPRPFVRYLIMSPRPANDPIYNFRNYADGALTKLHEQGVMTQHIINAYRPNKLRDTLVPDDLTADKFLFFLEFGLGEDSTGKVLCMDNASQHHPKQDTASEQRFNTLVDNRQWLIQWLPPYNPKYNIAELAIGYVKQYVRKRSPRDYDELRGTIEEACRAITGDFIVNWMKKCGYGTHVNVGKNDIVKVDQHGAFPPAGTVFTQVQRIANKHERPVSWPDHTWPRVTIYKLVDRLASDTRRLYVKKDNRFFRFLGSQSAWVKKLSSGYHEMETADVLRTLFKHDPVDDKTSGDWEEVADWKEWEKTLAHRTKKEKLRDKKQVNALQPVASDPTSAKMLAEEVVADYSAELAQKFNQARDGQREFRDTIVDGGAIGGDSRSTRARNLPEFDVFLDMLFNRRESESDVFNGTTATPTTDNPQPARDSPPTDYQPPAEPMPHTAPSTVTRPPPIFYTQQPYQPYQQAALDQYQRQGFVGFPYTQPFAQPFAPGPADAQQRLGYLEQLARRVGPVFQGDTFMRHESNQAEVGAPPDYRNLNYQTPRFKFVDYDPKQVNKKKTRVDPYQLGARRDRPNSSKKEPAQARTTL